MFKYLFTFSNKRKAAMQINVANWKHLRTKFDELKLMTAVSEVDDIIQTCTPCSRFFSSMRSRAAEDAWNLIMNPTVKAGSWNMTRNASGKIIESSRPTTGLVWVIKAEDIACLDTERVVCLYVHQR
jgi:hypothetical protein